MSTSERCWAYVINPTFFCFVFCFCFWSCWAYIGQSYMYVVIYIYSILNYTHMLASQMERWANKMPHQRADEQIYDGPMPF